MSNLTKKIMRRVYVVWLLRQLLHPVGLRIIALVGIFWGLQSYISFRSVITNLSSTGNLLGGYSFWQSAFTHTELSVQILTLAAAAVLLWLVWDAGRAWLAKSSRPLRIS